MPEITYRYKNETTQKAEHHSVCTVSVFKNEVEITRIFGSTPNPYLGPGEAYIERKYQNVSEANLQRLHNVIAKLVNKGQAEISLQQVGSIGIWYEVQL